MNIDNWLERQNVFSSLSYSLLMGRQVKLDLCITEKNFRMNQSEVKLAKVFTPKLPWERTDGVGLGEGQSHLTEGCRCLFALLRESCLDVSAVAVHVFYGFLIYIAQRVPFATR